MLSSIVDDCVSKGYVGIAKDFRNIVRYLEILYNYKNRTFNFLM